MVDFYTFEVGTGFIVFNFINTFVGTLFTQTFSMFLHLRAIYTNVVDFHTFEGSFTDL